MKKVYYLLGIMTIITGAIAFKLQAQRYQPDAPVRRDAIEPIIHEFIYREHVYIIVYENGKMTGVTHAAHCNKH